MTNIRVGHKEAEGFVSSGAGVVDTDALDVHLNTKGAVLTSNGVADQTSRINAALLVTPEFSGRKTVRFVGDFNVTQIVVPSNTIVDFSAARITQIPGTQINTLVNAAVLTNKRTIYAAMTSGSAVLTATATNETTAAAPFAATDVGRRIIVQGAGVAGAPLDTTISTYTSASSVTLAVNAATTVSGQYAAVGDRDKDITIIGGLWNRSNNGPDGSYLAHQMRFRHVDGISVVNTSFNSSGGKYAINPGDCTRINIDTVGGEAQGSDVVHINGPASYAVIRNINVRSIHDDLVSLTAGDSTGLPNKVRDTAGDITDVEIDTGLYHVSTYTSSCLKIVAGKTMGNTANYAVKRVRARNFTGPDTNAAVVYIGDASGGVYDDIDIDGVNSLGGSTKGCVIIQGGTTLDRIRLMNLHPHADDSYAVSVGVSINRLEVSNVKMVATAGAPWAVYVAGGTISRLTLDNVRASAPGGSALRIVSGATVTNATITRPTIENGFTTINIPVGGALGHATVSGVSSTATAYPLGFYNSTTTLSVTGLIATGATALAWVQGSGALTVLGATGIDSDNYTWLGAVTHKHGAYGIAPIARPALTYSRTGESAAAAQMRTTLTALGLVTDSTTA